MRNKLYYLICILAVWTIAGCEDLEDTYDEFTGNGRIRYLGKCSNVEVLPGWKRIRVVWKNNIDAAAKYTKITWQSELDSLPFVQIVERDDVNIGTDLMDTLYLENLQDALYTVSVSNVIEEDSVESIVETQFVRPYSETHEALRAFTRGISNFYCLEDKMVVVLDEDNENLDKMELHFFDKNNQKHIWDIRKGMVDSIQQEGTNVMRNYMQLLPAEENINIDFSKPMSIFRVGHLPECLDEITFKPEILPLDEISLYASTIAWLTKNYGQDWETSDALTQIETVELDYDMTTFQDLLYFPNLKKVILGKNRFMINGHTNENLSETDTYKSLMTLQFLKDTRPGFTVERYNNHYFDEEIKSILEQSGKIDVNLITQYDDGANLTFMPQVEPLAATNWDVVCSDENFSNYKENGAGWLLDGDATTYFEPGQTLGATVFEVKIDMKEAHILHGFKISQPDVSTATKLEYLLSSLQIEVSENGYEWMPATHEKGGVTIGDALGEITFIQIPEELQSRHIRYIRLTMANRYTSSITGGGLLFSLRLGDFIPY